MMFLRLWTEQHNSDGTTVYIFRHTVNLTEDFECTSDMNTLMELMIKGLAKHLTRTYVMKTLYNPPQMTENWSLEEIPTESFFHSSAPEMSLHYKWVSETSRASLDELLREVSNILTSSQVVKCIQVSYDYYVNALLGNISDPKFNVEGSQGVLEWVKKNPYREIEYCNAIEAAHESPNSSKANPYFMMVNLGVDFSDLDSMVISRQFERNPKRDVSETLDRIKAKGEVPDSLMENLENFLKNTGTFLK